MIRPNVAPTHLRRADEATTPWHYDAPPGTTIEEVLDPDFWMHVAGRLASTPNRGLGDTVRVCAVDGSLDCLVTVVAVDPRGQWAEVHLIWNRRIDAPAAAGADKDGYVVEYSGPHRWRVLNGSREIVARDLPNEAAAQAELSRIKAQKPKGG